MGRKKSAVVVSMSPVVEKQPKKESNAEHNKRLRARLRVLLQVSMDDGGLVSVYKLKKEDAEEWQRDVLERRVEMIKMKRRMARPVTEGKEMYPIERRILIDLSKRQKQIRGDLEWCLSLILMMVDSNEIYMYNPTGEGSGYKYYRGEKLVVYQITELMTPRERQRTIEQIKKTCLNKIDTTVKANKVYKVVITTIPGIRIDTFERYDMGEPTMYVDRPFLWAWSGCHTEEEFESGVLPPKLQRKKEKYESRRRERIVR